MNSFKPTRPIFLCGMMGSGKSTIGWRLAKNLGVPFADLDSVIEKRQAMSIPDIFRERGEEAFRAIENNLLMEMAGTVKGVLALGGGSLQNQHIIHHLKQHGWLVYLESPRQMLVNRLKNSRNRPMLKAGNLEIEKKIDQLIKDRAPYYSQAHITVLSAEQSKTEIVYSIIKEIRIHEQKN